jgi:hypothetical protein
MIEQLPALIPNPQRSDRTLARCRKKMAQQVRAREQKTFAVERAVFLGFGVIYLSSLAFDVVRMLTM